MNELVSVPVITYNSSSTVIETLESIKEQTYPNIELIISDDCSTDNTVAICREWLEKNKGRFARIELLTVKKNTGVAGNCNRAGNACKGVWKKGIAGDDIMLPNCIQDCMDYITEHPDTIYLFGRCKAFGSDDERCKEIDALFDYSFFNLSPEQQLHRLIIEGNCIPATAVFINRKGSEQTGVTNDERIPYMEDWPKWINLIKAGVKFHFIDKVLVQYRVSENSLSTGRTRSEKFNISSALFYKYYCFPYEYKYGKKRQAVENWLRAQNTIHKNKFWYMLFKSYKLLIMHKFH